METQIIHGNTLEELKKLPNESVQLCITSPPYWSLRYYSSEPSEFEIGREKNWREYVNSLLIVFAEVKRVLKSDGSFFLNLGDMYISTGGKRGPESNIRTPNWQPEYGEGGTDETLPAGCQLGMPWRVAFAMTDTQGWILRNDIVWVKLQAKPESVESRFSKKHEFIFYFSKNMDNYFDMDAVRIPMLQAPEAEAVYREVRRYKYDPTINPFGSDEKTRTIGRLAKKGTMAIMQDMIKSGKNGASCGDWWIIPPAGTEEEHTAAYSEDLCHRPILACSRPGDIVLDPFSGTGTTAVTAHKLGRVGIGIELYEKYVTSSRDRLNRAPEALPDLPQRTEDKPEVLSLELQDEQKKEVEHREVGGGEQHEEEREELSEGSAAIAPDDF